MKKFRSAFGGAIVTAGILAIAFVSFYLIYKSDNPSSYSPQTAAVDNQPQAKILLKLVDKSTNEPIKNSPVRVKSNDGTKCKRAPCPTNDKTWDGSSDSEGKLTVPADMVQIETALLMENYQTAYYSPGSSSNTVAFER